LKECIVDRGSRYTITVFWIHSQEEWKKQLQSLKKNPYFAKATHNSYAWRIKGETGIIEGKNDDGEAGAGMCILREIQRVQRVNICIVVTRYFWGIQLQADRYKHIIDGTKMILEKIKTS
jgi:putative IMPACT (imprinted ancient) family translation regulator